MPGFRTEKFYINKFGDDVGKKKYKQVIKQRESRKINAAVSRGFKVYSVWESDFLKNPDLVKLILIKWWNDEQD